MAEVSLPSVSCAKANVDEPPFAIQTRCGANTSNPAAAAIQGTAERRKRQRPGASNGASASAATRYIDQYLASMLAPALAPASAASAGRRSLQARSKNNVAAANTRIIAVLAFNTSAWHVSRGMSSSKASAT